MLGVKNGITIEGLVLLMESLSLGSVTVHVSLYIYKAVYPGARSLYAKTL